MMSQSMAVSCMFPPRRFVDRKRPTALWNRPSNREWNHSIQKRPYCLARLIEFRLELEKPHHSTDDPAKLHPMSSPQNTASAGQTWEQRWHPLREEWVIIAAHRNERPWTGEKVDRCLDPVPTYS